MIRIPDDDELAEMSTAEVDELFARLTDQHNKHLASMTASELYAYRRNTNLGICQKQRRLAKTFHEIFWAKLKETQRRLLEARIEYRTGVISGHS